MTVYAMTVQVTSLEDFETLRDDPTSMHGFYDPSCDWGVVRFPTFRAALAAFTKYSGG